MMTREQIERHAAFKRRGWYYMLELAPGLFTPGEERPNVALTRHLLRKIDIEPGVRCLDVGTQECLVPILLERRGADVVAYDRIYSQERLELVRAALGTEFELIGEPIRFQHEQSRFERGTGLPGIAPGIGMPLVALPDALSDRGHPPFDVVVFSGVLYHVYDPLAALAVIRGLARNGGIVVVETAALFDGRRALNLNAAARFAPWAVWLPSLGCLDYLLRLVRLEPIDGIHIRAGRRRGRVALACRAVDSPPADPGDEWIGGALHDYELAEYLDWERVSSMDPAIGYRAKGGRIDLVRTVRNTPPHRPTPEAKRLSLDARY
jgi:SAM-dependent methyltransferase